MRTLAVLGAVALLAACSDSMTAPRTRPTSADGPRLAGTPPPPPVGGKGGIALGGGGAPIKGGAVVQSNVPVSFTGPCGVPIVFSIHGSYYENDQGTIAWVQFTPDVGSGHGIVFQFSLAPFSPAPWLTPSPPIVAGELKVPAPMQPGEDEPGQYEIRLLKYVGSGPLLPPHTSVGSINGSLTAEVEGCENTVTTSGFLNFDWAPVPPPAP